MGFDIEGLGDGYVVILCLSVYLYSFLSTVVSLLGLSSNIACFYYHCYTTVYLSG